MGRLSGISIHILNHTADRGKIIDLATQFICRSVKQNLWQVSYILLEARTCGHATINWVKYLPSSSLQELDCGGSSTEYGLPVRWRLGAVSGRCHDVDQLWNMRNEDFRDDFLYVHCLAQGARTRGTRSGFKHRRPVERSKLANEKQDDDSV